MVTPINFIILALSTWRIASLLSNEDGPWAVFANIRHATGERYDEYSNPYTEMLGTRWYHKFLYQVSEQLSCLWCCSVWVGIAVTLLYIIIPQITTWISLPFALSAVGVYLNTRARFRK